MLPMASGAAKGRKMPGWACRIGRNWQDKAESGIGRRKGVQVQMRSAFFGRP